MTAPSCTAHGACSSHTHAHARHRSPAPAVAKAPHAAHGCCGDTHTTPTRKPAPQKSYLDILADHPAVRALQIGTGLLMVPMVPVMVYALSATIRAGIRTPTPER